MCSWNAFLLTEG